MPFVVAACSSPVSDAPQPSGPFLPRPQPITLAGVDPCDAITDAQAGSLGVSRGAASTDAAGNVGCSWQLPGSDSYRVTLYPATGARAFAPGHPDQAGLGTLADRVLSDVDGFGAVTAKLVRGSPGDCAVIVDADTDSSFMVSLSTLDPSATYKTGCAKARRFTSLALRTLASTPR